jgi:hypothetical protein
MSLKDALQQFILPVHADGKQEVAMKVIRVSGVLVLSLVLVCAFQGLAAAQLLKKATQMVNISSSSTTGVLDGDWTQVMPDGTTAVFSIPLKKVLVISSFTLRFKPTATTITGPLRLLITSGDPATSTQFFGYNLSQNKDQNGYVVNANLEFNFNPGLAVGIKPTFTIIQSNTWGSSTGTVVPGDFGMRIFGIIP